MGLENTPGSLKRHVLCSSQCNFNLVRMMSVIVYDGDAADLSFIFETSAMAAQALATL